MEIKNLLTFLRVAELNSFTKAAQELDYSQSTISFQIKQLETELDCLLFERINHTLLLTDEGRQLQHYAQKVCRLTDEFHQTRSHADEVTGHVHLVVPDSVCEAMILENYQDFFRRYPGIRLRFSTADTEDMFRLLDRNEADLMFTLDNHVYHKNYTIIREARMGVHFYTSARSALAETDSLTLQELTSMPVILTEPGMSYRRVLDDALAQRGLAIQPVLEIGRTDLILKTLKNGEAVSFLPDFVASTAVQDGSLVRLNVTDLEVDIWQQLIRHRSKWLSRALNAFVSYVCEHEFQR